MLGKDNCSPDPLACTPNAGIAAVRTCHLCFLTLAAQGSTQALKPPGPLLSLRNTQTKHYDFEDFWVQSSTICHRWTPKLKAVHKDGWG